jgi:hypothetical protein
MTKTEEKCICPKSERYLDLELGEEELLLVVLYSSKAVFLIPYTA